MACPLVPPPCHLNGSSDDDGTPVPANPVMDGGDTPTAAAVASVVTSVENIIPPPPITGLAIIRGGGPFSSHRSSAARVTSLAAQNGGRDDDDDDEFRSGLSARARDDGFVTIKAASATTTVVATDEGANEAPRPIATHRSGPMAMPPADDEPVEVHHPEEPPRLSVAADAATTTTTTTTTTALPLHVLRPSDAACRDNRFEYTPPPHFLTADTAAAADGFNDGDGNDGGEEDDEYEGDDGSFDDTGGGYVFGGGGGGLGLHQPHPRDDDVPRPAAARRDWTGVASTDATSGGEDTADGSKKGRHARRVPSRRRRPIGPSSLTVVPRVLRPPPQRQAPPFADGDDVDRDDDESSAGIASPSVLSRTASRSHAALPLGEPWGVRSITSLRRHQTRGTAAAGEDDDDDDDPSQYFDVGPRAATGGPTQAVASRTAAGDPSWIAPRRLPPPGVPASATPIEMPVTPHLATGPPPAVRGGTHAAAGTTAADVHGFGALSDGANPSPPPPPPCVATVSSAAAPLGQPTTPSTNRPSPRLASTNRPSPQEERIKNTRDDDPFGHIAECAAAQRDGDDADDEDDDDALDAGRFALGSGRWRQSPPRAALSAFGPAVVERRASAAAAPNADTAVVAIEEEEEAAARRGDGQPRGAPPIPATLHGVASALTPVNSRTPSPTEYEGAATTNPVTAAAAGHAPPTAVQENASAAPRRRAALRRGGRTSQPPSDRRQHRLDEDEDDSPNTEELSVITGGDAATPRRQNAARKSASDDDDDDASTVDTFSHIQRLPLEILRYGVDHYLPVPNHFRLRRVCRLWNAMVVSNCCLWARRIPGYIGTPMCGSQCCNIVTQGQARASYLRAAAVAAAAAAAAVAAADAPEAYMPVGSATGSPTAGGPTAHFPPPYGYDAAALAAHARGAIAGHNSAAQMQQAALKHAPRITYCFKGCAYRIWRAQKLRHCVRIVRRFHRQKEKYYGGTGSHDVLFGPGAGFGTSVILGMVAMAMAAHVIFFSELLPDALLPWNLRYFVIPVWICCGLVPFVCIAFYYPSSNRTKLAASLGVFAFALSCVLRYFFVWTRLPMDFIRFSIMPHPYSAAPLPLDAAATFAAALVDASLVNSATNLVSTWQSTAPLSSPSIDATSVASGSKFDWLAQDAPGWSGTSATSATGGLRQWASLPYLFSALPVIVAALCVALVSITKSYHAVTNIKFAFRYFLEIANVCRSGKQCLKRVDPLGSSGNEAALGGGGGAGDGPAGGAPPPTAAAAAAAFDVATDGPPLLVGVPNQALTAPARPPGGGRGVAGAGMDAENDAEDDLACAPEAFDTWSLQWYVYGGTAAALLVVIGLLLLALEADNVMPWYTVTRVTFEPLADWALDARTKDAEFITSIVGGSAGGVAIPPYRTRVVHSSTSPDVAAVASTVASVMLPFLPRNWTLSSANMQQLLAMPYAEGYVDPIRGAKAASHLGSFGGWSAPVFDLDKVNASGQSLYSATDTQNYRQRAIESPFFVSMWNKYGAARMAQVGSELRAAIPGMPPAAVMTEAHRRAVDETLSNVTWSRIVPTGILSIDESLQSAGAPLAATTALTCVRREGVSVAPLLFIMAFSVLVGRTAMAALHAYKKIGRKVLPFSLSLRGAEAVALMAMTACCTVVAQHAFNDFTSITPLDTTIGNSSLLPSRKFGATKQVVTSGRLSSSNGQSPDVFSPRSTTAQWTAPADAAGLDFTQATTAVNGALPNRRYFAPALPYNVEQCRGGMSGMLRAVGTPNQTLLANNAVPAWPVTIISGVAPLLAPSGPAETTAAPPAAWSSPTSPAPAWLATASTNASSNGLTNNSAYAVLSSLIADFPADIVRGNAAYDPQLRVLETGLMLRLRLLNARQATLPDGLDALAELGAARLVLPSYVDDGAMRTVAATSGGGPGTVVVNTPLAPSPVPPVAAGPPAGNASGALESTFVTAAPPTPQPAFVFGPTTSTPQPTAATGELTDGRLAVLASRVKSQATIFCASEHQQSLVFAVVAILTLVCALIVGCVNVNHQKAEYYEPKIVKYKDFFDADQLLIAGVSKAMEWGIPGMYFAAGSRDMMDAYVQHAAPQGRRGEGVLLERGGGPPGGAGRPAGAAGNRVRYV